MFVQQAITNLENWIKENNQAGIKMDSVFLSHLEKGIQLKKSNWVPKTIQNTYLKEFEIPQIVLFDLLTKKFPLVTVCQQIAEKAFLKAASGKREICILDIEISTDALNFTLSKLNEQKINYKFELNFHLINSPVELITYDVIKAQIPAHCDCFMVNASLTLHHIQQTESRLNLFNIIKQLNPQMMILIELDADTMNDDYAQRLLNAAKHFSALYNYVNTLDVMNEAEANNLKSFFANDFFDPIVLPDSYRFERLQTSTQWIDLLLSVGLKTLNLDPNKDRVYIPNIDCTIKKEGYFNLSFAGTPLISVIAIKN